MAFHALGLNDRLVQGILATGYTAPTEIQARAIPLAVAGKDIIGCAQTGTGKTAAFTLPILNRLADRKEKTHHIKALVLTPTRELAQQIEDAVKEYGRFLSLRSLTVVGGMNIHNQLKHLQRGVDILIATPGRLIDHLERKSVNLAHVEVLVLDEADRMFDMGFIDDVRRIIKQTPHDRQTLLFSATMSKQVRILVKDIQQHPELIEVGERRTPATTVTQYFYSINEEKKMRLLLHILQTKALDSVLVFSRTKVGAEKISNHLHKSGIKSISIHSDRTQAQRQRALSGFKQGQYNVLVATDVAARGIDVDGISHVINYDIPGFAEDYIHRIGRTGRAQSTGDALTFVTRSEIKNVKRIEQFIGKKFEIKKYPDFDDSKVEEKPMKQSNNSETQESSDNFNREERRPHTGRNQRNERHGERKPDFRRTPQRRDRFNKEGAFGNHRYRKTGERTDRQTGKPEHREGEQRTSFGSERSHRDFSKRRPFGNDRRDRNFRKPGPFSGNRNERGFEKRDSTAPHKREHNFRKQESFSASGSDNVFRSPRPHSGPDWKNLIEESVPFKGKREHEVVRKMVSRKKKDS